MRALPQNWNFSSIGLAQLSSNGRDATRNCLIEMEQKGYLRRIKYQDENGQFDYDYELFHKPTTSPMPENPSSGNPSSESQANNKELINQELINKEHTAPDKQVRDEKPADSSTKKEKKPVEYKSAHKDIAEVIHAMVSIDAKNKLYYNNTTQKKACDFLIQEYTLQTVLDVISGIPKARVSVAYFPSITTPCELRDKWVKAFEAIVRDKKSKSPVVKKQSV